MPRYFFNVSNSLKVRDPTGIMLADDSAAFSHAHRLVRAIATDGTKSMLSASVMVMNEAGEQVLKLPVAAEPSNAANSATRSPGHLCRGVRDPTASVPGCTRISPEAAHTCYDVGIPNALTAVIEVAPVFAISMSYPPLPQWSRSDPSGRQAISS